VAGTRRVFHTLQDVGDFIDSVGGEVALKAREDACCAADEIVQASPVVTGSSHGRLPTVFHTFATALCGVVRRSGHDTSPNAR
jgi:hypothetical protein